MNSIAFKRTIDEEELSMVHKAVEIEMMELRASKTKTHTFQEIKESLSS